MIGQASPGLIGGQLGVDVEFPSDVGGVGPAVHLETDDMVGFDMSRPHPLDLGRDAGEVAVLGREHVEHDLEVGVGTLARLRAAEQIDDRPVDLPEEFTVRLVLVQFDDERVQLHQRADQPARLRRRTMMDRDAHDDGTSAVETGDRLCSGHRRDRQQAQIAADRAVVVGERTQRRPCVPRASGIVRRRCPVHPWRRRASGVAAGRRRRCRSPSRLPAPDREGTTASKNEPSITSASRAVSPSSSSYARAAARKTSAELDASVAT